MKSRWRKRQEPASHIDDWLMTYADMITLLLCFFAIFLSVALVKKEHQQKAPVAQAAEQAIAQTVKQPGPDILEGNLPLHGTPRAAPSDHAADAISLLPSSSIVAQKYGDLTMPVAGAVAEIHSVPQPETAPRAIAQDVVPSAPALNDVVAPPPVAPVPKAEADAEKSPASLPQIVDRLKTQGPANIEEKGDRLTTLEINSAAFFGSGSATLSKAGEAVLRDVAANIKSDKFKDYQVTVEGHTDDSPIKTVQFPSNWELSTARAAAVVHFFIDQGVPAQRLRAAGYADTFPKVPNRDAAGNPIPANQAQNRRVVIKLEKIEKTE